MRLKERSWNLLINGLASSSWFPERFKPRLLGTLGAVVDKSARIRRRVDIYGPNLTLRPGVFINVGTQVQNYEHVFIGSNVQIGPRVTILTVNHDIGPATKRAHGLKAEPVMIGDGCWIAASSTIFPGVKVGSGCIIAAGSVVTSDCEPNGLYAGVPAKRVRNL